MPDISLHSSFQGGGLHLKTPAADTIKIKPIREATEAVTDREVKFREAERRVRAADSEVSRLRSRIESEAALAAEGGGDVPAKKLVRSLREAQDELEEARLERGAREKALIKARANLIEVIQKHTPAWRAEALKDADRAILEVTTARERLNRAAAELAAPLAVLQLLHRVGPSGDGIPVMAQPGTSHSHASIGLDSITTAVGEAIATREAFIASAKADEVAVAEAAAATVVAEAAERARAEAASTSE